ncbi:MAG: ATP-binding protein [Candidatus Aminicenantales bacterium]
MITNYHPFLHQFPVSGSKELQIFSILAQSFFQPFSLIDNLLVILTALTAGSGLGFNRAMLFLVESGELKGKFWLGPASVEEAASLWEMLSRPGISYAEIIESNRRMVMDEINPLTQKIKKLVYRLDSPDLTLPARAASSRQIVHVQDASCEPLVDQQFLDLIGVTEFLCIPLFSPDEVFGEIVLDNAITREPIKLRDIELASLCGLAAGNYIYVTKLQKRIVEMKKQAALGEMALFVAHQMRNPLVTVGGFVDQLLDPNLDETRKKRNLAIIREEVSRLEEVVSRLTRFFHIDIREKVPVNLQEIFKITTEAVKPLIGQRQVAIETEVKPGANSVYSDPIYLGEALRNLVENALEALTEGGVVKLKAFQENQDWIVLSVEDNGRGIPDAVKDKIFDAFITTKEKGLGLGLAYVKKFIEANNGWIKVESQEGKGTVFKLYFKARPE